MLKLDNFSFEGYMEFDMGGARTAIARVKVNEVISSVSVKTVERFWSFEKTL